MGHGGVVKEAAELLVNRWGAAVAEFEDIFFELQGIRDEIDRAGLSDAHEIKFYDKLFFEDIPYYMDITERLYGFSLQDDPSQPLEKWWWHLNKIVKGEYPINKLPEHLREIYREEYYKGD